MKLLRIAIAVSIAAAFTQAVLLTMLAPEGGKLTLLDPAIYVFVAGPPVFFALLVWRRRKTITTPRLVLGFAVAIAAIGIAPLANEVVLRSRNPDPHIREQPSLVPLLVPFAQWVPILVAWAVLIVRERKNRLPRE